MRGDTPSPSVPYLENPKSHKQKLTSAYKIPARTHSHAPQWFPLLICRLFESGLRTRTRENRCPSTLSLPTSLAEVSRSNGSALQKSRVLPEPDLFWRNFRVSAYRDRLSRRLLFRLRNCDLFLLRDSWNTWTSYLYMYVLFTKWIIISVSLSLKRFPTYMNYFVRGDEICVF